MNLRFSTHPLFPLTVQFAKFGMVGIAGLLVDSVVLYALLYAAGLANAAEGGFLLARIPSFLAAATATWGFNRLFTFRHADHGRSLIRQWAAFVAANSFGGMVNYGVYAGCIATGGVFLAHPVLGVAVGSLAGMIFNFTASKKLVFKGA